MEIINAICQKTFHLWVCNLANLFQDENCFKKHLVHYDFDHHWKAKSSPVKIFLQLETRCLSEDDISTSYSYLRFSSNFSWDIKLYQFETLLTRPETQGYLSGDINNSAWDIIATPVETQGYSSGDIINSIWDTRLLKWRHFVFSQAKRRQVTNVSLTDFPNRLRTSISSQ